MKKSKIATTLRRRRVDGLSLPKNTNNEDLLRWWKSFIDGDSAVFIAEREGRQVSVIEKGLSYTAAKLGAPSAYVEKCRLIESYHRSMVDLNKQIEKCNKSVADVETMLDSVSKPDIGLDEEVRGIDVKLWLALVSQRNSEVALRIKLYQELRAVSMALENIFGLKHLAVPDSPDQEEAVLTDLDKMSIETLNKLLESADEKDVLDAEEVGRLSDEAFDNTPRSF